MKTDNKEKKVYVQPDGKVYQVKLQQMIATSSSNPKASKNEEYEEGSTSSWFTK